MISHQVNGKEYILIQKKLQLRQHALEIPEDNIQNMGIHGSITGKTMTRIICFDHITTATTPLPNRYRMKRTSYNYKVIYT